MTPSEPDPLERLLDDAGRAVQPAHSGWQQLPQRLANTPQAAPRPRWRIWVPLATAAAILLALALWLSNFFGLRPPNEIEAGPIEVQQVDVELTVLSSGAADGQTLYMPLLQKLGSQLMVVSTVLDGDVRTSAVGLAMRDRYSRIHQPVVYNTGQALVKDHRLILNLKKGDNVVRFTDIAASIDPTSVRLVSNTDPAGTQVVEQNFEYDLANADSLLHRYLDRKIVCIGKDGQESSGYLMSHDPRALVLASAPTPPPGEKKQRSTETLDRAQLRAIRLEEVPSDLLTKPTLVWKLRAKTPGKHDTTLSYLCGMVKWQADYVAIVTPGKDRQPDLIDITGWVTLENTSGATYKEAGLKLIAGDVNRVVDPWAVLLHPADHAEEAMKKMLETYKQKLETKNTDKKEFVEKSFFEYHLYTLSAPSTLRDRQTKQLGLLQRTGVKASRRYVFDPSNVFDPSAHPNHPAIELVVKNEKENNLGLPLPKGRVAFEQRDIDGDPALLGRVEIDHTPVKEEMTFRYGKAFDVVGEHRQVDHKILAINCYVDTFEFRVRNHKAEEIQVRTVTHLGGQWEILKSSVPPIKHDYQTVYFDFALKPNAEQVVTYTVEFRY